MENLDTTSYLEVFHGGEETTYSRRMINRVSKPYEIFPDAFTDKSILDIGANIGNQSYIMQKMGNRVTAHDINPDIIPVLKNNVESIGVQVSDNFEDLKFLHFDTVFCSSVLMLQKNPIEYYEKLLTLDFDNIVIVYHDNYTIPMHDHNKMFSPDIDSDTDSLITKEQLVEASSNLTIIEKDASWDEDMPINDIYYKKTIFIAQK